MEDVEITMTEEERRTLECVYEKPDTLTDMRFHYCPGCGHSAVHRVLMEVVHELGIQEQTMGVAPVGCSVFAYHYLNIDMQEAAHGRASAVATAVKRILPDHYVFSYQGDGDLAAIGTAETIHTANRGENILVLFINNAIYGMTGGQMAPTTLLGMKTSTSPAGRTVETAGFPLKITEMIAMLPGRCLRHAPVCPYAQCGPAAQEGDHEGLPLPEGEEGALLRGGRLELPVGVEDDAGGSEPLDRGAHVPALPSRRYQSAAVN